MRKIHFAERFVYYFCSFIACFACLGTFAAYFLSSNNAATDAGVHRILKICCPLVMILAFILMSLTRCCVYGKTRNNPANAAEDGRFGFQVDGRGQSNGGYQWQDLGIVLPSYSETINNQQYSVNRDDPPPKYEEVVPQRIKPEENIVHPFCMQSNNMHQGHDASTSLRTIEVHPRPSCESEAYGAVVANVVEDCHANNCTNSDPLGNDVCENGTGEIVS